MKEAVGVIGMHRSGTSMITRALSGMGLDLGTASFVETEGNPFNPLGYYEHQSVTIKQEQILRCLSMSWDTCQPLPPEWELNKCVIKHKTKLRKLIIREFAHKEKWGWKDPRTSLLLPMWQKVLSELNIQLYYVIVIRNPLDVTASLYHRNGFSKKKSLEMWCLYTLSSLMDTQKCNRLLIHYEMFLKQPKFELCRAADELSLPAPTSVELEAVISQIHPALQHYQTNMEDIMSDDEVSEEVKVLYELCHNVIAEPDFLHSERFDEQIKHLYEGLYQ